MTETFHQLQRSNQDPNLGAPSRQMPFAKIVDIVSGKYTADINIDNGVLENGMVVQYVSSDVRGRRALGIVFGLRQWSTFGEARAYLGDQVNPDLPPVPGPVVSYQINNPIFAHSFEPVRPDVREGMCLYDVLHFQGTNGTRGMVSVQATDLENIRGSLNKRMLDDTENEHLQNAMINASTSLVVETYTATLQEYTTNSVPTMVYCSSAQLSQNPPFVTSQRGVEFPWRNASVIVTPGCEMIRIWMTIAFGHVVIAYERQLAVFPLEFIKDANPNLSVKCELVFGTEVTMRILEAANALLFAEGDVAIVGIYTPLTSSITTNLSSGWNYIEGNIPRERIAKDNSFKSKAEVYAYLAESWRNFVHVRYPSGHQIVIFDPRYMEASRITVLPMSKMELSKYSMYGPTYLSHAIFEAANMLIKNCTQHATLQEHTTPTSAMVGTVPLFFDQSGTLRRTELMAIINRNFQVIACPEGQVLHVDTDFKNSLDVLEPEYVKYVNTNGGIRNLVLNGGKTGTDIYDAYIERFLRMLISVIYVCSGQTTNFNCSHSLVYSVYRLGMQQVDRRDRIFSLLSDGYDWLLVQPQTAFSAAFSTLWKTVSTHVEQAKSRLPRATLHKTLLIGYVLNRSVDKFEELEANLSELYTAWSMYKTSNVVIDLAKRSSRTDVPIKTTAAAVAKMKSTFVTPPPAARSAPVAAQSKPVENDSVIMRFTVDPVTFSFIVSGCPSPDDFNRMKTIDVRISFGAIKVSKLTPGKRIDFYANGSGIIPCVIVYSKFYATLADLVAGENYIDIVPSALNPADAITQLVSKNPRFTSTTDGFVAIKFSKCETKRTAEEEMMIYGERLYKQIVEVEPQLASKITGMLLELDAPEIINLLDDSISLSKKISECKEVLMRHGH